MTDLQPRRHDQPSLNTPYNLAHFAWQHGRRPVALLPGGSPYTQRLAAEASTIATTDDITLLAAGATTNEVDMHEVLRTVACHFGLEDHTLHFDPSTRRFFLPAPADPSVLPPGWEPGPDPVQPE